MKYDHKRLFVDCRLEKRFISIDTVEQNKIICEMNEAQKKLGHRIFISSITLDNHGVDVGFTFGMKLL